MYTLNQVIKEFKKISLDFSKDDIAINYYNVIIAFLLIENNHKDIVKQCNKPLYHYFMYHLPQPGREYFNFLYNVYHPVRFAIETFSTIGSTSGAEEFKIDLEKYYSKKK